MQSRGAHPQLELTCAFLLFVSLTSFKASSAAPGDSVLQGCPKFPFTPNIVASKQDADLRVVVPNITSLRQLVNCSDPARPQGLCIDVFQAALSIVSPSRSVSPNSSIHYTCFNFSNGATYDDMIQLVANKTADVVVGDVTIGAQRSSLLDFTQKYLESGVVILANVAPESPSPWLLFTSPFSVSLWAAIVIAFVAIGVLICCLEYKDQSEFAQGHIYSRLNNMVWFSIETLVLLEREPLRRGVSRCVVTSWVIFVLILGASYTAGLSAVLTTNNLSPSVIDLPSLKESGLKIGYRRGSIVKDFLNQRFQIPSTQLVDIRMTADFVSNLTKGPKNGGVAAIVDERPYAEIILSVLSSISCDFGISGPPLTQEGFGFGFYKGSDLGANFSIALMNLTESGCLQELLQKYHISNGASGSGCSGSDQLSSKVIWKSSLPLLILLVVLLLVCLVADCFKRKMLQQPQNRGPALEEDYMLRESPSVIHRKRKMAVELEDMPQ